MAVMQGPPVGQEVVQQQEGAVQQQEGPNVFPKDQEQAEKFLLNTVKVIHEDERIPEVLNKSLSGNVPKSSVIGALAAQLLTLLFTQVFKQTNGASVVPRYAVEVIRRVVLELSDIAEAEGVEIPKAELQKAAKIAGDTLQQSMDKLYANPEAAQEQQAPQQAPQGQAVPPQGQLQGPPQGQQQGGM